MLAEQLAPEEERLRARLAWLAGARLFVVTVLFGGTIYMSAWAGRPIDTFTPRTLVVLVGLTYVWTVPIAWLLQRGRALWALARAQIAWDMLLTSALVALSGGLASVFSFLFGVVILISAIVIGPSGTRTTAGIGVGLYVLVGASLFFGIVPHPPDQPLARYAIDHADAVFSFTTNVLALGLVGALGYSLSSRLTSAGGELRRAAENAASLARLNDDIVRSLTSGLVTIDETGHVRSINPAALEMLGAREDAIVGSRLAPYLSIEGADKIEGRLQGMASRVDGTTFPVGFTVTPLSRSSGDFVGKLVLFQDLTEIEGLRLSSERAERLATLGKLSAGLAHEIRNPLSSISGSVELIRESTALHEEEKHLLGIVLAEVERLNDLVTTMLQVGRPKTPTLLETDLHTLVKDVIEMAKRGKTGEVDVAIVLDAKPEPIPAFVDDAQIRQVIWNLIKNALQFARPGTTVSIGLRTGHEGHVIEVRDEGPGISKETRARLFETFYSGRAQGVGLGLALVRQIVEGHGGSVEVESELGRGATFRVKLPRDARPSLRISGTRAAAVP